MRVLIGFLSRFRFIQLLLLIAVAFAGLTAPQRASAQAGPQTITICKKASPADGTVFPFSRSNGSGALPNFALTSGQCQTFNLANADHLNTITENVPAGWTLSNISCTAASHSGVAIVGANANPAFQPGDTTVKIDLADPGISCTFENTKAANTGMIKLCKVAGPGVTPPMPFTILVAGTPVIVPAGPGPGGTCMLGPSFTVNTNVVVDENVPLGYAVTNIDVQPPGRVVVAPNLPPGTVTVQAGSGVTEVTYTNQKNTGFIEICKQGHVSGNYTFNIPGGTPSSVTVPAGACSPAIEVAAGTVTITETASLGIALSACSTLPAGPCTVSGQTVTVTVAPGDISAQTIVMVTNKPVVGPVPQPPGD